MASETDFLNGALGLCSSSRITHIDDGSANANWCKVYWPPLRKSMIRMHHWNFAEDRATLGLSATPPKFEFAFAFDLPPDLLKIKEYNGANTIFLSDQTYWMNMGGRYKIEGRQLFSNEGEVKIVYLKDVENPDIWDSLFYQAAESWLASKLALAISKDARKSGELFQRTIGLLLPFGLSVDGQEGTVTPYIVDDLIWGR